MILLPLEVLPGWPEPEPVSSMFLVALMIIGPLLFAALVTVLYFGPRLARERREQELQETTVQELETSRPA